MNWLVVLDSNYIYPNVVGNDNTIEYEEQDPESSIELT
jgi:hypothetical protein